MDELEEARKKEREKDRKREALRLKREEELKKKFIRTGIIAAAVLVCVVLGVVSAVRYTKAKEAAAAAEKKKQQEAALAKEQEENIIDFLAVGDNIAHLGMRESGMKESGDWNYDAIYQPVKADVEAADLALVTQETVFVENRDDISGYPSFGTPPEFGDALVDTGFDVVAHATNHILDKGTDSIEYTMKWWKEKHPEIPILGIHQDQEDAEHITVVQCKALKLAMLDYTYGLNDIPLAEDKSYMVDVFDQEKARADIRKAREEADVVIVVMHVGEEYVQDVDEQTRQWVDLFLEEDVDIVIGSHPHVIRTMETLTGEDGHKMLVYYSLGNFTSTQNDLPSLLGAMAKITIKKDVKTGAIQIPEHEFIPLLMHYNHDSRTYGIYKLNDYTQELADQHTANERNPGEFSISYYKELFEQIKAKGNGDEI
ncbi:CapA family protein [Blautia producta]|uniref:Capsule biosynthesis protein CapA n=1 Tax=Blautia producta TaxID=33035 RepID=A0A4P6M411_9FIRM|nr:CapA family protein [Blautia producta]QBE99246.1 Capsule biosynthesis protein CapA [Blautia producta]